MTALHATDEKENIEMIWCHNPVPKFYGTIFNLCDTLVNNYFLFSDFPLISISIVSGTKIETEVHGKRELKLLNRQETYVMNSPKLVIRLLPFPGVDWVGNVTIKCEETGLQADLYYKGSSFLSNSGNRSVKGNIFMPSSSKTICEINGHWER